MSLYKPSELQAFLKSHGMAAKKGLSQNFLIDGNIVHKIVQTAAIAPQDRVLEIGPGPGALTQALLETGANVTAIEMDQGFATALKRLQTEDGRLQVITGDVLTFPMKDFLATLGKKCKVVANLPYHITTPILTQLLPLHEGIDTFTIMVQKEFADRMTAQVGTADYSSFTLFLQFYSSVISSFKVSPNCFFPRPKVHSAVVHCQLHPPPLRVGVEAFFQLTRAAFGKRRKMLRSSLKEHYDAEKVEKALGQMGRLPTTRPEELALIDFISLYEILSA